jgi:hypothetical protein
MGVGKFAGVADAAVGWGATVAVGNTTGVTVGGTFTPGAAQVSTAKIKTRVAAGKAHGMK